MKSLHVLALGACLWLAGCATQNAGTSESDPASHTAGTPEVPAAISTGQPGVMPTVEITELKSVDVARLSTPVDLWDRIRRGFAMPDLDTELVLKQQQWYLSRPDYIERMVERSRLYLFHVVEELELRGMPTELALLPYIESAFNPQAISSAKAAGLWQFMPATGKDFDLRQNMLRDDRRDVLASTRAALDYLQMLHDMFGDWHLALAAYNWGQGNVGRAIARNKAEGLPTGYLDLTMPDETRNYVPKLQAVKNIIASPQTLGAALPLIGNHPFFDTVEITQDIDVEVAARLADIRLEDFKALNPSQRKPIIFAAGTPQVLLPWDNASLFKRNLASADPSTIASWTAWVAPVTLNTREAARRVQMDEAAFRQLNGLRQGVLIRKGSTVLAPRNGHTQPVASDVVNNAQLSTAPEVILRRTQVRARAGDTIATLAARYDLPAATVARWNKARANTKLKAGRAVVVYLPTRASGAQTSPAAKPHTRRAQPKRAKKAPAPRAKPKARTAAPRKASAARARR